MESADPGNAMDFDLDSMLEEAPSSEKQTAKLRKSCELCRTSKGRCCPSPENNRCQRCLKEGKECIFLTAKPRPKRGKNSRTRVAEMEQKLDSLYALISASKDATKEATPSQVEVQSAFSFEATPPYQSAPSRASHRKINQQFPVFSLPFLVFDNIQDVISKGIVSFDKAEESLQFFRKKSMHFPFVYVSPQASLDSLRREKPFLLHSILTIAAQSNLKLQKILELELREKLSNKLLVHGEKSLDILQGVLVYLGWYHFFFDPNRMQIYQLSQMAATMAIELGLNRRLQNSVPISAFSLIDSTVPRQPYEEMERMRTFLGCFYMASSVCLALRKPNILPSNDYIDKCSYELGHAGNAESDHLVPYFIRLQQFSEDVSRAFEYDSIFHYHQQLDSDRVGILSKKFLQQLDEMRLTFPPEIWNNVTISMSYHTSRVYLHEVGFHTNIPPSSPNIMSSHLDTRSWYNSSARNDSLIACLQATKEYLESLLSLPSQELLTFTLHDFVHLIYAVLVLGRFASGCDCPPLDNHLRKSANFDHYIVKLITLTEPVIGFSDGEERVDYIFHLRRIFQASQAWLNQISSEQSIISLAPQLSFMDLFPTVNDRPLELSTTRFGFCPENSEFEMSLIDLPTCTSVDPSLLMIEGGVTIDSYKDTCSR